MGATATGALVAVVVAATVGVWSTRAPALGDIALIEMDTRRVLSRSPPLAGAYSRYGWRHPGPAVFGVFAVPYRLLGSDARALAAAALLVNTAAACTALALARRRGRAAAAVVAAALVLLIHGMGADGIGDPWNVSITLVPLALVVVACWASLCGDPWGPPVMVLGYLFVAQAHVGNGVAITPVVVLTAGWIIADVDRRRALRPPRWVLATTTALVGLALLPVAIDVARHPPGTIGRIVRWSLGHDEPTLSWERTLRLLGRTSSLSFPMQPEQPRFVLEATTATVGVLPGALVVALAGLAVAARRAGLAPEARLCAVVLAWWAAALVAVTSIAEPVAWWLVDWLQPLGWLTVGAIALTAWRLVGRATTRRVDVAACGALLAVAAVAVAGQARTITERGDRELAAPPVGALADAAAGASGGVSLELDGPDFTAESVLAGLVNELDRRGVGVCVEARLAYKFPPAFGCSGVGMTRLVLRTEPRVEPAPAGTVVLAIADPLDPATRARADDVRESVLAALDDDGDADLAAVVDTSLVAVALLDTPSPSIAALAPEIRWLAAVRSGPHTRYALYAATDPLITGTSSGFARATFATRSPLGAPCGHRRRTHPVVAAEGMRGRMAIESSGPSRDNPRIYATAAPPPRAP